MGYLWFFDGTRTLFRNIFGNIRHLKKNYARIIEQKIKSCDSKLQQALM